MPEIRLGTSADYEAIAALITLINPHSPVTAERLLRADANRDPKCKSAYFVAEENGEFLGCANYVQFADLYHPQKFWVSIRVMPEHRQKGIGSALFDRLFAALKEHQAITLHTSLQEDNPAGLRFAGKRGFEISTTRYPSILETATFDASPYDALFARLEADGIQFFSYVSLASDPERDEKMLALQTILEQDVPLPIPATPLSLEQYRKEFLLNPRFDPEASMIAIHQGNYIGLTIVFREINQILGIDFTGVASSYRGKGIATALKVRMAQFAQANHLPSIHTTNDAVNAAILGVNDKMGFVRQPAIFWMELNL